MTKEDLIGRKFVHKDDDSIVYTITDVKGNGVVLYWISPDGTVNKDYKSYTVEYALETIEKNTWKLLPIENKMYKTPKGIEYGVGTRFTNTIKEVCIISKVENDKFFIDKPKYGIKDHKVGTEKYMSNMFDKSSYKIINTKPTMKDYKQVDPKTIKFDFTNTKIKVNNEDESEWLSKAAVANGYEALEKENYNKSALFFWDDNTIAWGDISEIADDDEKKEITIQDILNNMQEVIEVGDIVLIVDSYKKGTQVEVINIQANGTIDVKHINDPKLGFSNDYETTTGYKLKMLKLVSKGKKKEIIGYETVVDLPGISKGTKLNKEDDDNWTYGEAAVGVSYSSEVIQDTKFFKPIYKQDAIVVKFSKYIATLSKEYGLVFSDGEKLTLAQAKALVKVLHHEGVEMAGFKVSVRYDVINVGCKVFNDADLHLLSDAIKKLDE